MDENKKLLFIRRWVIRSLVTGECISRGFGLPTLYGSEEKAIKACPSGCVVEEVIFSGSIDLRKYPSSANRIDSVIDGGT